MDFCFCAQMDRFRGGTPADGGIAEKQILRTAYPTAWGPKRAALRMTRSSLSALSERGRL
jgi:hypothetical protein